MKFTRKKIYLILFIALFYLNVKSIAQTIIHNENINVIYKGVISKLSISNAKIKNTDLILSFDDKIIKDSNRYFYVFLNKNYQKSRILFKLRNKNNNLIIDSVLYRVKSIQNPIPIFGTLVEGSYKKSEFYSQNSLYCYMPDLVLENVKAKVLGYKMSFFSQLYLETYSKKIIGNNLKEILKLIQTIPGGFELIIDSVYYELLEEKRYSGPVMYRGVENNLNQVIKANLEDVKSVFISTNSDLSKLKCNYFYVLNCNGNDTTILIKKELLTDNHYKITYYEKNKIESVFEKLNDTLYSVKIYDSTGNVYATGYSSNLKYSSNNYNRMDCIDSFNFSRVNLFLNSYQSNLVGEWKVFNSFKNETMILHYKKLKEINRVQMCGYDDRSNKTGIWKLIDNNNNILLEVNHED